MFSIHMEKTIYQVKSLPFKDILNGTVQTLMVLIIKVVNLSRGPSEARDSCQVHTWSCTWA